MLEGEGHGDELGVVPRASQQWNVDGLMIVVECDQADDSRNAIGGARRVSTPETLAAATPVIDADLAGKSGIDDSIHTLTIGACRVHPGFGDVLPKYAIVAFGQD